MSRERDSGIVLSKKSSGEGDDICVVFTKGSGRERFVFKGLKKSAKRARTASEPGTVLDIIYYTGISGINTVSEFDILTSPDTVRKKSEKIYSLWYMLELINLTTGYSDPHPEIFSLLSAAIETLSATEFYLHLCTFFTVRYMMMQGIFPDIERCSWCGNTSVSLFIEKTGLRTSCLNCGDALNASIGIDGTRFLNLCVSTKFNKIGCSDLSADSAARLLTVLVDSINSYYQISIRSTALLLTTQGISRPGGLP